MRLLVLLSGIFASGAGAFCFAVYTSTFYDVAFLVGVVMLMAGAGNTIAYLISGKGERKLTETTLVEGMVTFLYGFAVLNNQVTESMLTMFFGTWLTLCGVTRFSQSLYVSRFNPRDWSKIIPLSIVSTVLGVVMMLPWLLSSVMPLMLVGGAFLLDGLSMIIYAMYMKDSTQEMAVGEARAKARAEARKEEHEAKLAERARLRNLSKEEREKEEKRRKRQEKEAEAARLEAKAESRAAMIAAMRPVAERTRRLEASEVAAINEAAEEFSAAVDIPEPESFPSIKIERYEEKVSAPVIDEPVITAVKLDEIEVQEPIVSFEKVELPIFEFASDLEKADRDSLIADIENIQFKPAETVKYEKLDLDALIAEPIANKDMDNQRFTQTLDFSWVQKLNDELDKKDEL